MPPHKRKLQDKYFKQAKREGYVARSAYKLLELNDRRRILRKKDRVLDLGCAPGSWLQVAREIVGERGLVVGIDLKRVDQSFGDNVYTMVGDFTKTDAATLLGMVEHEDEESRLFDAVISDMAPNTTGHGDDFMSCRLCHQILDALPDLLRPNGRCVMKVFEGGDFPELLKRTKSMFKDARPLKPDACRDVSRETYIVGNGYRPILDEAPKPIVGAGPSPKPPSGWGG
jgi:23S rRNA (uridine2552-2'-O)-methyltransferase